MRSHSPAGAGPKKEADQLLAAELFDFTSAVRTTVQKLTLTGCAIEQVSFETPVYRDMENNIMPMANSLSPPDHSCHVFHPAGGNLAPYVFKKDIFTDYGGCSVPATTLPGHFLFRIGPMIDIGRNDANDVVMHVGGISNELCAAINKKTLGLDVLPVSYQNVALYQGTNINASIAQSTLEDPLIAGKSMFCMRRHGYNGCSTGPGYEGIFTAVFYAR